MTTNSACSRRSYIWEQSEVEKAIKGQEEGLSSPLSFSILLRSIFTSRRYQ